MHKIIIPGVKSWHPNAQSLWGNTIPSYNTMNEQHPEGLPRGREDDRPSEQHTVITTRLVQRTWSWKTAKTKCHRGKVCKNLQWLKILQAKTRCASGNRQKERTVITDKMEENHSRDEHHSVEGLLPPEATQINT